MSRILHDGMQQFIVAAKMQLNSLHARIENLGRKQEAREIERLLDEAVQVSRTLAAELSPPILRDSGILVAETWLSRWKHEKYGLKVQLVMDMDAPTLAEDVKILLFECVREMLLNVVKHAQTKSVKIHLFQAENNQLGLTVSDNGKGFEVQAENPGCPEGFGLFSIQERLSVIGGTFQITSAPGKGCRITLTAPLGQSSLLDSSKTASETQPVESTAVPSPASAGVSLGKVRILIVDDHIVMREGLARLLAQEADFDVIGQATNGQQAIERATLLQPALILMDISMPVLDGIEATKIIHKQHPHIHIIGLSLYTEDERAREMLSAGASFYMSKEQPAKRTQGRHPLLLRGDGPDCWSIKESVCEIGSVNADVNRFKPPLLGQSGWIHSQRKAVVARKDRRAPGRSHDPSSCERETGPGGIATAGPESPTRDELPLCLNSMDPMPSYWNRVFRSKMTVLSPALSPWSPMAGTQGWSKHG